MTKEAREKTGGLSEADGLSIKNTKDTPDGNDDRSESGSDTQESIASGEILSVGCDFYDFNPIDNLGLKTLLKQTFHGDVEDLDYGSLADLIILQPHLGSTAKTDGPEGDPMAFITLIDLQEYAGKHNNSPLEPLIAHLSRKIPEPLRSESWFSKVTNEFRNMGLIINERVINVPPNVVTPLLMMLLEEIDTLKTEKRKLLNMENFIYVSKVQIARTPKNGHSRKKRKRSAEPGHRGEGEITFFVQQEDSIFEKFAESSFEYACGPKNSLDYVDSNGTAVNTLGAREVRRVFIVPFNALEDIYSEMNEIYPCSIETPDTDGG